MDVPKTRWAKTVDGASIAYQDFGSGSVTVVCIMGWVTHLEIDWEWPGHAAFMRRLSRSMRVLNFDKRGTGMSDQLAMAPGLDAQMDDVRAVMDAAGVERAAVLGTGSGGPSLAAAFAATHPDRTLALFIYGWLHDRLAADNPVGSTEEEMEEDLRLLLPHWGDEDYAEDYARQWLPRFVSPDIPGLGAYFAKTARYGNTPTSYESFARMWFETNVRDLLPTIHVPTFLILGNDPPEEWRVTTRNILSVMPCARAVELKSKAFRLIILDDPDPFVAAIEDAIASVRHEEAALDRRLATVLFTDVVGSTHLAAELRDQAWAELLERHNTTVRTMLARYRGTEIKTTGDGFLATFDGPARAVKCAQAICEAVKPLGLEVRAGCHTGEIELMGEGGADVGGIAVHIGARVGALAGPSEVLVSSTVKDLVAGSGLVFEDRGEHTLKGVPDPWHLYAVASAAAA